jgi:hypothetical protein
MRKRDRPPPKSLKPCNWRIEALPGLSPEDQARLHEINIHSTLELLQQGSTPPKQQQLATRLHIHLHHVRKWVALADLARIPSVGCQYAGLLLHAGIASAQQLAQTPLHRLHPQLLRLQVATMQRPDLCPPVETVAIWVQEARSLTARSMLRTSARV